MSRHAAERLTKGEQTRAAIVEAALALAARDGLEGLTIGLIAERTGMSKSGVFAHFGSREDLQIATLREYHRRFETRVFLPALQQPRGLPRLQALFERWVEHVRQIDIPQGCIYVSGAAEYDDRAGAVRDELVRSINAWQQALQRAVQLAIEEKHLRADTEPEQMAFEIYGIMLALHHDARLLHTPRSAAHARRAFIRLIDDYRTHPAQSFKKAA